MLNKALRTFSITTIILGIFWTPLSFGESGADNTREEKIQLLEKDIEQLKVWLKKTEEQYVDAEQKLKESEQALSELSKKINQLKAEQQEAQSQIKKLEVEQQALNDLRKEQKRQLGKTVRYTYMLGSASPLKVLLQSDPSRFNRNHSYLKILQDHHQNQIIELNETLKLVNQNKQEIAEERIILDNKIAELNQARQKQNRQQQQRAKLIDQLEGKLADTQSELRQKQTDRSRLKNLVDRVGSLIKPDFSNTPFAVQKGRLPMPTQGKVSRQFNQVIERTNQRSHGWVINSAMGENITAIHDGIVVFADWLRGYGLLVIVDHGQQYLSLYGRNQALLVQVGDRVQNGSVIARTGATGGYREPSLYFELRHKGQPINPARWIRR